MYKLRIVLTYIVAKFVLKGAVKSLLLQPAISATLSVVPKATLIEYSLLGKNLSLNTSDLLKFGLEKFYEFYGEKKLNFSIDQRSKSIYQIIPANDLARRFFKEYTGVDQLEVDLNAVDSYLDILYDEDMKEIEGLEEEIFDGYEAIFQILHDFDNVLDKMPSKSLINQKSEQQMIDEIIAKNSKLVEHSKRKLELKKVGQDSEISAVFQDFPEVKFRPQTDQEKIDEIINKFSKITKSKRKKTRA